VNKNERNQALPFKIRQSCECGENFGKVNENHTMRAVFFQFNGTAVVKGFEREK